MTQPLTDRVREAALRIQGELADERTPFVFDEWYVAGFADEVTRTPLARRLLEDADDQRCYLGAVRLVDRIALIQDRLAGFFVSAGSAGDT